MRVQRHLPGGRPVPEENLHLTLLFLDDQPQDRLQLLDDILRDTPIPPVELTPLAFAPLGSKTPRAVVLDVVRTDTLVALRDTARRAARQAGIALSKDRLRPHITLTRYSGTAPADYTRLQGALARLGAPDLSAAMAHPVTLWSSTLTPEGPIYDALATYGAEEWT